MSCYKLFSYLEITKYPTLKFLNFNKLFKFCKVWFVIMFNELISKH